MFTTLYSFERKSVFDSSVTIKVMCIFPYCCFPLYFLLSNTVIPKVVKVSLPNLLPDIDTLKPDESPISELMNVAYAGHEITDEYLFEVGSLLYDIMF